MGGGGAIASLSDRCSFFVAACLTDESKLHQTQTPRLRVVGEMHHRWEPSMDGIKVMLSTRRATIVFCGMVGLFLARAVTSPSRMATLTRSRLASAAASGSRCLNRFLARDEARARVINLEHSTKAVVFDLKEPIGIVEGCCPALQRQRRNPGMLISRAAV
jgi:hypothetical protein